MDVRCAGSVLDMYVKSFTAREKDWGRKEGGLTVSNLFATSLCLLGSTVERFLTGMRPFRVL